MSLDWLTFRLWNSESENSETRSRHGREAENKRVCVCGWVDDIPLGLVKGREEVRDREYVIGQILLGEREAMAWTELESVQGLESVEYESNETKR